MEVNIYGKQQAEWVKRQTLQSVGCGQLYDVVNKLNEQHGQYHWVFPAYINPVDHPLLDMMETVALNHIEYYHNDFYLWDTQMHFNYSQKGLWLLRETGTNYIPLGSPSSDDFRDRLSEEKKEMYEYYLKDNDYFYLIEGESIKRLTRGDASNLIKCELSKLNAA